MNYDLESACSGEFSMKIMGSVNYILGMDVCNSIEVHTVHLYHSQYINNLITFNNMGLYVWQPMH